MAQAPQNPYQGVQGVRTAWATLARWVSDTLPSQWLQLQEIIDYVGGAGAPSGPPVATGPTLGGASPWPASSYLNPATIGSSAVYLAIKRNEWENSYWAENTAPIIGRAGWDGSPTLDTLTAATYGFDVMIGADQVTVWPGGQGYSKTNGAIKWEPGRLVVW